MNMFKNILTLLFLLPFFIFGQEHHPQNGVKKTPSPCIAIKNARIIVSPTKTIEKGTLLFSEGKIVEVGKLVIIPKGAVEIDGTGKTIIASFIELNSNIGLPKVKAKEWSFRPQIESSKNGAYYWNEAIHPESKADQNFSIDKKANERFHQMGFGFAVSHFQDGVAQGTGVLVALGSESVHKNLLVSESSAYFSFDKGVSRQTYPSSQMGSIALLRQSLYDHQWYTKKPDLPKDLSLEAYTSQLKLPLFFQTEDKWEILRAQKIAKEFNLEMIYFGSGNEYAALGDLKNSNAKLVLPLNFPAAFEVKDPYISRQIPLSELKHWELAPKNPSLLAQEGLEFGLSSYGLKSSKDFWGNLQKAIEAGLSPEKALAALTTIPARMLNMENEIGTLEKGKQACFTVYDGNPFEEKAEVFEVWINGEHKVYKTNPSVDIRGNYNLIIDGKSFPIQISGSANNPKGKIQYPNPDAAIKDSVKIAPNITLTSNDVVIQFAIHNEEWNGSVNLKGKFNDKLGVFEGSGQLPTGTWVKWSGIRNKKYKVKDAENKFEIEPIDTSMVLPKPISAFGRMEPSEKETILIKNVTLWTCEEDGKIENGNILITDGKITDIGPNVTAVGAIEIDGTGKHVTPGIIDEHSHIAISKGVNESGQAVTSEVSIATVVNSDDINIYRQLSGGVTAAQLLHGSANPIGGQSALIKLKWGYNPNDMLLSNSPKFIKCALGENVKQANWGPFNTVRFPQTRMGVEQVFYDAFMRAKAYEREKESGDYRFDLELEALLEIVNSERFITCHSYIQSEINMLMHVADSMGFKINTFTHILEGYKLADKMAAHGAGGSTFADWWAYKYEVKDAIPYNAQLMQEQGVVVAINSDDAEMGRRLNQEAAKAVKYGGMSEIDALKMVTLNPAILLHLDDRMGSLKIGKDADVVLWSAHPLTSEAKAEMTIVDGEILYDRNQDQELLERDAAERARILSLMLNAIQSGESTIPFNKKPNRFFHCDTVGEEGTTNENHH